MVAVLHVNLLLPLCAAMLTLWTSFPGATVDAEMINGIWVHPKAEQWASRTIYQIMTDRIGSIKGEQTSHCKNFNKYCGGTYEGIYTHFLDYIKDLGFDAIWVSPVSAQTAGPTWMFPDGYHGYWTQDYEKNNDHYGSEADFIHLVEEAHSKGIWVMLDIVPNHMGFVNDYGTLGPFNETGYYHDCGSCFGLACTYDMKVPSSVTWCRLSNLIDLDHDIPFVRDFLLNWTLSAIQKYRLDGLRVDAAKHTNLEWLQKITIATDIFSMGEYPYTPAYIADGLNSGALKSAFNFPLQKTMHTVFVNGGTIKEIYTTYEIFNRSVPSFIPYFGNFVDSHDEVRLMCEKQDVPVFKNALTILAFYPGIPIIYYGSEQGMLGQRDPLWHYGYSVESEMYLFIQAVFTFRRNEAIWSSPFTNVYSQSDSVWVFSRGDTIIFINSLRPNDHVDELYATTVLLPDSYTGLTLNNLLHHDVSLVCQSDSVDATGQVLCYLSRSAGHNSRDPMIFNSRLPVMLALPSNQTNLELIDMPALYAITATFWAATVVGMLLLAISANGYWVQLRDWFHHKNLRIYSILVRLLSRRVNPSIFPIPSEDSVSSSPNSPSKKNPAELIPSPRGLKKRPKSVLAAMAAHLAPHKIVQELVKFEANKKTTGVDRPALRKGLMLHVAMEYTIPQMGYANEFVFGGLGKVVDVFLKDWPGSLGVCCPLYADIYESPTAAAPKFADGASPDFNFTVQVNFRPVLVGAYLVEYPEDGVTYFFLQADIFRHRTRDAIYTFQDEEEMLTWLSVFNKAVAAILVTFEVQRVQFHDYHGSLSLLYLPLDYHPEVMYVAHNAHYNGTFPIPNKDRRLYVFGMFDLDVFRFTHICEHKGYFDFIYAVVNYMKLHQKELGVVAVSPRYADQISSKLSAYWRLKRRSVVGVTNALPLINCLASSLDTGKLDLKGALECKKKAKKDFQKRFGLTVGDQFSLIIFLGRLTHQKGCDLIALAASKVLSECPFAQLVMVGPVGDTVGKEAQEDLDELAPQFPGRVYAPPGKYFSGEEKELLLVAADFYLVPSRFEPCGLVDIELGWNGAIIIGHDTGGLGKMPGVYFKVESSAQQHLSVKLADACVKAYKLSPEQRAVMIQDALGRRFDTKEMMDKYEEHWLKIDAAVSEVRASRDKADKGKAQAHNKFYQDLWRTKNKQALSDEERGEMRGVMFVLGGKAYTKECISNLLLLLMQAYSILPGVLVMGYCIFVEIATMSIIGCRRLWDLSEDWLPELANSLFVRVVLFFGVFAVAAPCWVIIMVYMRPINYIRLCTTATFLSMLLVHVALTWTAALNVALVVAAAVAPSGLGLVAVGFLGEDQEVSEVGLGYLTTVEMSFASALFLGSILPAFSNNQIPFLVVGGIALLLLGLVACWFWQDVLTPAYIHMMLTFKGQWRMLLSLKVFWLTLVISIGDWVQYLIFTYIVLVSWNLTDLMQIYTVTHGTHVVAVFASFLWLKSRWTQMHVQAWTMALAAVPGLFVIGSAVVGYSANLWTCFLVLAIVELIASPRRHLVGLLAFQTLPTREIVTMWQMTNVVGGSLVAFMVIIMGYSSARTVPEVNNLMVGVGAIEVIRTCVMLLLYLLHHQDNLATL